MKVEVSRQDVSDSAAMLQQMEQWEKFIDVEENGVLSLKLQGLEVTTIVSRRGIHQLEAVAWNRAASRLDQLKFAIATLCQKRSQELAKEVCELIRKSMPLPLEQSPSK